MKLAIQPPSKMVAGLILQHPVVVTFEVGKAGKDEFDVETGPDITTSWVFLSLMSEDGTTCLTPPDQDLLQGRVADSIHRVLGDSTGDHVIVAYATFSNLVISTPGTYCFRVSIIDMNE